MSTRESSSAGSGGGDLERDAWLSEALRHAPDADAAPSPTIREAILRQAHAEAAAATRFAPGARGAAADARPAPSVAQRVLEWWRWLGTPRVAGALASVVLATVVGLMWWDRPIDEALQRAEPAADSTNAPAATAPADIADRAAAPSASSAPLAGGEASAAPGSEPTRPLAAARNGAPTAPSTAEPTNAPAAARSTESTAATPQPTKPEPATAARAAAPSQQDSRELDAAKREAEATRGSAKSAAEETARAAKQSARSPEARDAGRDEGRDERRDERRGAGHDAGRDARGDARGDARVDARGDTRGEAPADVQRGARSGAQGGTPALADAHEAPARVERRAPRAAAPAAKSEYQSSEPAPASPAAPPAARMPAPAAAPPVAAAGPPSPRGDAATLSAGAAAPAPAPAPAPAQRAPAPAMAAAPAEAEAPRALSAPATMGSLRSRNAARDDASASGAAPPAWSALLHAVQQAPQAWRWQRDRAAERTGDAALAAWLHRVDQAAASRWRPGAAADTGGSAAPPVTRVRLTRDGVPQALVTLDRDGGLRVDFAGRQAPAAAQLSAADAAALWQALDDAAR